MEFFEEKYEVLDQIEEWLSIALDGQEVEDFQPAYNYLIILVRFYLAHLNCSELDVHFILNRVIYLHGDELDELDALEEGDSIHLPICESFKLAKLLYIDADLKNHIEGIVNLEALPCGCSITPNKLQFLKSSLHYAKNFHPNYLPEHLLER